MNKIIKIILFYLIITAALVAYFLTHRSVVNLAHGVYMSQPEPVKHFELIDNQGDLFTEKQLKGHWSLLFFGFSSCAVICPMTMQTLKQSVESLPKNKRPQVIFISVDPQKDTLQKLNQFINQFNSHFIALRGGMEAVNALQKQLHVPVSTTPMSHGTEILLINPQGDIQAYFYYPISAKNLVADLNQVIH